MSTKFYPLQIPPGVVSQATKQMNSSNWSEVNLMRWREGSIMPVGGQQQYAYQFASRCKKIHSWYGLNATGGESGYFTAYLCETNLYIDAGGTLFDVTPTQGIVGPIFAAGGYGSGLYNTGTYGTPRALGEVLLLDKVPDAYTLDNFGGVLLAMASPDGFLLQWDPNLGAPGPGNRATRVVADTDRGIVPTGRCFVVTAERFVMVFGSFDVDNGGGQRRFAWCDQENYKAWDYSNVTSQAGFLDIEPASPIICAMSTRTGTLFWTGKKCYQSQFLGTPYIYNYVELAANCTPWSPQSMVNTTAMACWFSEQGPMSFDGTSVVPIVCAVRQWIDADIDDVNVREQACAVHVAPFNEFWWFFPQFGQPNNTRAAIYNYKEGWWSQAQMARSAGVTAAYNSFTIMANGTLVYQHDLLNTYTADADLPWAETFDLNITPDARLITIKQIIPDIKTLEIDDPTLIAQAIGSLRYSLFYRNSRSLGTPEKQTALLPVRQDGYVDCRTTGRDIRLRFEVVTPVVPLFTLGKHMIDAVQRGDR